MNDAIIAERFARELAKETAERMASAPMCVQTEKHFGVDTSVSIVAEAARKEHCLCIREENGAAVTCERLKKNFALQNQLKKEVKETGGSEEEFREKLMDRAVGAFTTMAYRRGKCGDKPPLLQDDDFKNFCPIALVNYALCVSANIADGVSRCPYYLAPKETTSAAISQQI